jgi:hypothetical protein
MLYNAKVDIEFFKPEIGSVWISTNNEAPINERRLLIITSEPFVLKTDHRLSWWVVNCISSCESISVCFVDMLHNFYKKVS